MEKYIKIYKEGFNDGMIDAYKDFLKDRERLFSFSDKEFMAKLYDLSYINGYKRIYNILLLINKKI